MSGSGVSIAALTDPPSADHSPDPSVQLLADRLLHEAPSEPGVDGTVAAQYDTRGSFPSLAVLALSVFIAYHVSLLLVHGSPDEGPGKTVRAFFRYHLQMDAYMGLTGNATKWNMFADPPRGNAFVRVLAEDAAGKATDMRFDIYGRRQYPYLFFDRLAKINFSMLRVKENRAVYAAWACREWERQHGVPARRVRLEDFHTETPPPDLAYATGGYHPLLLPVYETRQDVFECATLPHGQWPVALRARVGLPPVQRDDFRDVDVRTWWERAHGQLGDRTTR